jgi:hypothetical protein
MFKCLTETDKDNIKSYIEEYATGYSGAPNGSMAPLEHILRFWAQNKTTYLYQMFNQELILSKEIEFTKGESELAREIDKLIYQGADRFYAFYQAIVDNYRVEPMWGPGSSREIREQYNAVCSLFNSYTLAANKTDRDASITLKNGKILHMQEGAKPMRLIKQIAESWGVEGFEEFRLAHSRILNQKTMKGTLCLSIHPLDFMTMSDNNNGWSSCMSWADPGGYRRGTVEMMNSECVVVAYLKSDSSTLTLPNGEEWNSKKWRSLFVVHPDIIASIKGYPYRNDELTNAALEWLVELANSNNNWDIALTKPYVFSGASYQFDNMHVRFWTNTMYNDCGAEQQFAYLSAEPSSSNVEIDYSGPENCMYCGEVSSFPDESCLMCEDCSPVSRCSCCGEPVYDGDGYWVNDELYCNYCYDEYIQEDPITGELYDSENDDCVQLFLIPDKKFLSYSREKLCELHRYALPWRCIEVAEDTLRSPHWLAYFNNEAREFSYNKWHPNYGVLISDCTERGLELFDLYNSQDVKSYLRDNDVLQ